MATPQTGTIVVALGSPNGPRKPIQFTASDAAGGITFPSGATNTVFHGLKDTYIVDFLTATAMATITTFTVFVNGQSTGVVIPTSTNIGTTIGRLAQQAPIRIPAGNTVEIIQA